MTIGDLWVKLAQNGKRQDSQLDDIFSTEQVFVKQHLGEISSGTSGILSVTGTLLPPPPTSCYLPSSNLCFCLSVPLANGGSLCRTMPLERAQGLLKDLMSESTQPFSFFLVGLTERRGGLKQQWWWVFFQQ